MVKSDNVFNVELSIWTNRNGIEYRVIYLDGQDLLLFPTKMFWNNDKSLSEYRHGNIVLSESEDEVLEYKQIGVWNIIEDGFRLTIFSKGFFHAIFEDFESNTTEGQGLLYELIAESPFEQLTIDAIKNKEI